MTKTVAVKDLVKGMIVEAYGDTRVPVTMVNHTKYGSTMVWDGVQWRGLSTGGTVALLGWFNA